MDQAVTPVFPQETGQEELRQGGLPLGVEDGLDGRVAPQVTGKVRKERQEEPGAVDAQPDQIHEAGGARSHGIGIGCPARADDAHLVSAREEGPRQFQHIGLDAAPLGGEILGDDEDVHGWA